jgi:Fe-S-cluster containining protein
MAVEPKPPVFQCRQCGDCCAGRGGIHVKPREVEEMAALLSLPVEDFCRRYVEASATGPRLATENGWCTR